ncbi:hypothetical protein LTR85_010224 [Meristemomyces frigidus]|nr:hypothetical protein LTR85_010224 [Meristemomyces frigidus]
MNPERSDLFGPLRLDLVFQGRICGIVSEATNASTMDKDDLLVSKNIRGVHDGPFRAIAYEVMRIHFRFAFPRHADPRTRVIGAVDNTGSWKWSNLAERDGVQDLPPSLPTKSVTFGGHGELAVEYWLEPKLEMPGIDVKFQYPDFKQKIRYDQARIPQPPSSGDSSMTSRLSTQSSGFVPENERPHGFREKTKAVFRSGEQTTYCFDVLCTGIPQAISLGEIIAMEVAVRTNTHSTAPVNPAVQLDHCKIELVARTSVETTHRRPDSSLPTDTQVVRTLQGEATPPGSFTKAHNYTKLVRTQPVVELPTSFSIGKLCRTYKLRIELQFSIAGQTRHARQDIPITVHPPVAPLTESAEAGSSRAGAALGVDEEQLPAYHEAVAEAAPPSLDDENSRA